MTMNKRELLMHEINEVVDAMVDHLSFSQSERLAIVVTPEEAQLLSFSKSQQRQSTAYRYEQIWYCGKRVMVEAKKDGE